VICITFDTDWMSDDAMGEFLSRIEWPGQATFFLHQHLPVLHDSGHELCPHPFITDLEDWEEGLAAQAEALPESPLGIRPHSCVFSHMLGLRFAELGYRYVSQTSHLYESGLKPHRHPWGLWEMPIYYMDNMDFCMGNNWGDLTHTPFESKVIERAVSEPGLYVFDFHPIHLALNTTCHEDYTRVKADIVAGKVSPFELGGDGRGSRVFFQELCDAMTSAGQRSYSCSEALAEYGVG